MYIWVTEPCFINLTVLDSKKTCDAGCTCSVHDAVPPLWWSYRYSTANPDVAGAAPNLDRNPLHNLPESCLIFPVLRRSLDVNRFTRRRFTTYYDINVDYVITTTLTSRESSLQRCTTMLLVVSVRRLNDYFLKMSTSGSTFVTFPVLFYRVLRCQEELAYVFSCLS